MIFSIRPYIQADTRPIMDLFYDTAHAINIRHYSHEQVDTWAPRDMSYQLWEQSLGDHHTYVAVVDGAIAGLFVVDRASRRILRRFGPRLGIVGLSDVATLPLLYASVLAVMLASDPITLAVSRHLEHEADRFALEITRDNFATASAFLLFQRDNLSVPYPDPFTRIWRSSHPALGDRIEFCNEYRPWATGQPLKYGGLFREP